MSLFVASLSLLFRNFSSLWVRTFELLFSSRSFGPCGNFGPSQSLMKQRVSALGPWGPRSLRKWSSEISATRHGVTECTKIGRLIFYHYCWENHAPLKPPKSQRIKSNSKVTQNRLFGVSRGLPQSDPKVTPKVIFWPEKWLKSDFFGSKSYFRGYFWVTLGETPKVSFESLSSYF